MIVTASGFPGPLLKLKQRTEHGAQVRFSKQSNSCRTNQKKDFHIFYHAPAMIYILGKTGLNSEH